MGTTNLFVDSNRLCVELEVILFEESDEEDVDEDDDELWVSDEDVGIME